ncbi:BLUF domain-containing protein [Pontixanthobacter aestiaquae]|uniref:Activator of photopigment and puc expression n=1 Tax=Pontixanthobacter aestiaquae TaxID=1509367 RepID=A0A844Z4C3_9SPHN|nr:BLUF domain-containing protein [Pontixanthobacter aestiaquae]MDN3646892.1 BLUF domain-containing protein [Pontixanthobacter aestiaquae]MXO82126.1 activator of photopigment and puc expression [Pontixanthobacter aestiaquae]
MRQFVYISTAAHEVSNDDVVNILESSRRNNPDRGITGFLIFNGRNFLQLVEGPEDALFSLMNQLARDSRHSGIVRLEDIPIETRTCEEWAMTRLRLIDPVQERRTNLDAILPASLAPNVRRTVLNFAALN